MSDTVDSTPISSIASAPTPTPIPQNSPESSNIKNPPSKTTQTNTLSPKQFSAINYLLIGNDERYICSSLRIDRKTLYNWRNRHPAFMAELNRRENEVWADVAGTLRLGVANAVSTLRNQLLLDSPTALRAARALIALVNSPRLAPTGPTTVAGVLDSFLRAATPPPADPNTPTFTDAQRQALLDQLLAEDAPQAGAERSAAPDLQPPKEPPPPTGRLE